MSRIVIVRHGNTFSPGTVIRRIGARTDLRLTDEGEHQASAIGRWARRQRWNFARALCGPLHRTRRTAELILAEMAIAPKLSTCDWLNEIDHGIDEGRCETVVAARIGRDALRRWDEHGLPPDGWQTDADWRIACWRRFFSTCENQDTLLVTSNGAARYALLAHPELRIAQSMKLATGAWAEIARSPDGLLSTITWNARPPDDVQE